MLMVTIQLQKAVIIAHDFLISLSIKLGEPKHGHKEFNQKQETNKKKLTCTHYYFMT